METFKNMSDEELIAALRKRNLPYGPIVGTTRTLYEKKLFEHERSKTINRPTLGAYDSQQHYTSRTYENDDDEDTYEEETVIRTYQYPQAHQRGLGEDLKSRGYYNENTYQAVSQKSYSSLPSDKVNPRRPIREKPSVTAPTKRYIPLWLQLLLLLLFTGYLAYMYFLKDSEENPFKKLIAD